jgi:probable HAF family extracellular repeat protein
MKLQIWAGSGCGSKRLCNGNRLVVVWLTFVVFSAVAVAGDAPSYSVTDIGVSSGLLTGINDYGQVVGWMGSTSGTRPFVWTPTARNGTSGSVSVPDGLFAGASTDAWGINAIGQVVGRSDNKAVLWNPVSPHSGIFGAPTELTQPGGPSLAIGLGINASGQVTGNTSEAKKEGFLFTPSTPNGNSGSVIRVGTLPPSQIGFGTGINNYGQVTGTSFGAFVWTPDAPNATTGQITRLAPALNSSQVTLAINNSGSITGPYTEQNGTVTRSFLWTPTTANGSSGSYVDLGTLGGPTRANGLNDLDQVVGDYGASASGFLWTHETGIKDLNTLLDPSAASWSVLHAYAINNAGQIGAAALLTQNGQTSEHFVLLTPENPVALLGDANGDGRVNFADLLILAQNYGKTGGLAQGDFNADASVGFDDLLILAQHYGEMANVGAAVGTSAVPEPACLPIIGCSVLAILARRRRA